MSGRRSRTPRAPATYAIDVPVGWVRVPGRLDREATVDAVAGQVDGVDPTDRGWRDQVGSALEAALRADTGQRVLDSYVPQGALPGTLVTAALVVSVVDLDAGGDPDQLLLHRAATRAGDLFDLDGSPAVRWSETVPRTRGAAPAPGGGRTGTTAATPVVPLARDHALSRVPGRDDLLLALTWTVSSGDPADTDPGRTDVRELVAALGLLGTAVTGSLRWVDADGEVPEADTSRGRPTPTTACPT